MILPIIAKIFQQHFDICYNSRMTGYYLRQSFCMSKAGKLVQVAGHAFELGHEVQMFAAQTLAHMTGSYQLAENFCARSSGSTGQCLQA